MEKGTFEKPINPNRPCKIFLFSIEKAIKEGRDPYDATRWAWTITEKYRDASEYEFAVGLVKGVSIGAFKIKRWIKRVGGKCEFEGDEIAEFEGFSWIKQIDVAEAYYRYGNHLVVEFDGNGKFRVLRPGTIPQWFSC